MALTEADVLSRRPAVVGMEEIHSLNVGSGGYFRAVRLREYRDGDWPQVWHIVEQVIRAGDTFCYDPSTASLRLAIYG